MSPLQTAVNQDLENALQNTGRDFLMMTNKQILDDLRGCTGEYINNSNLTMLLIIKQWRRKERRKARKLSEPPLKISHWKLETARLYCRQLNHSADVKEAIDFAEACYENIDGDIELESPQDCIDAEIDAMRSCT